jgi:hypothetical protein
MRVGLIMFAALMGLAEPCLADSTDIGPAPALDLQLTRMCERISYRVNTLVDHTNTGCRVGAKDENGHYSIVVWSAQAILPEHKLRQRWKEMAVDSIGLFAEAQGVQYFGNAMLLDRFEIEDSQTFLIPVATAVSLESGYRVGTINYQTFHQGVMEGLVPQHVTNGL